MDNMLNTQLYKMAFGVFIFAWNLPTLFVSFQKDTFKLTKITFKLLKENSFFTHETLVFYSHT
jgi:hypothetical protein